MKRQSVIFIFIGLLFLFYAPVIVLADSDGSLQLNSDLITTQSAVGSSASDFAIRSQLFSKDLDKKAQEKIKKSEEVTRYTKTIDFTEKSENELYKNNYQSLKMELFKDYSQTNIASDVVKQDSKNKELLIFLIIALPLMILTGFVARNLTRKKRRRI